MTSHSQEMTVVEEAASECPPTPQKPQGATRGGAWGDRGSGRGVSVERGFIGILKEGREEAGPAGLGLASLNDFRRLWGGGFQERLSLAVTYPALG